MIHEFDYSLHRHTYQSNTQRDIKGQRELNADVDVKSIQDRSIYMNTGL